MHDSVCLTCNGNHDMRHQCGAIRNSCCNQVTCTKSMQMQNCQTRPLKGHQPMMSQTRCNTKKRSVNLLGCTIVSRALSAAEKEFEWAPVEPRWQAASILLLNAKQILFSLGKFILNKLLLSGDGVGKILQERSHVNCFWLISHAMWSSLGAQVAACKLLLLNAHT